ncbi:MAG: extracellular solute-binding protein [Spirochaetaceae bacterium]|jgi:ABC-type glycerol-3-phosphate transport system substrate-binding protein|nr:extracellular solute-binding protein [Spirochaetaceae bacterium]
MKTPGRFFIVLFPFFLGACFESKTITLWTDRPEFAVYAEYFNSAQNEYKVETRYVESLSSELANSGASPDLVVGSWLKNASSRVLFRPLDDLFKKNTKTLKNSFYPHLLALGNIEGKQYLLPVSFNIPALVFTRNNSYLLPNSFTVNLDEIKALGKAYNTGNNGIYSRMGFSPSWSDDFLFITATLFNASFKEATPLAWDPNALEQAMIYVRNWIEEVNGGIRAEDDFVFKYFYDSPSNLALSGRILFAYMNSADLFTLTQEKQINLDFRWIAGKNTIPLSEEAVYLGICKEGKAKKAAMFFVRWFFQEDTQRHLMEVSRDKRLTETFFGIGNGFSALRTVTEHIFPQFYPNLLGHMPPEDFLSPTNILPRSWTAIKERVILPYLHDRIRRGTKTDIRPLERRLNDWIRLNRDM